MPTFRSKSTLAALIALALIANAQAAEAQPRDSDNPTCPDALDVSNFREMRLTPQTVNGRRVLLAEGVIDDNLSSRLEAALSDESIEEIWLRSPGGDWNAAVLASLIIRRRGIATRIPGDWTCLGACNFLFFGGTRRSIDPRGVFAVTMWSVERDANQPDLDAVAVQSARAATSDYDLLIRLGVSPRLLSDLMYRQVGTPTPTRPSTRRCLTRQEMREYRVVTG